jgi:hypothetical protein
LQGRVRSEKQFAQKDEEIKMGVALIGVAIVGIPLIIMGFIADWQERHNSE